MKKEMGNKTLIKRTIFFILLIIYVFVVFYLCLTNINSNDMSWIPKSIIGIPIDKYVHFLMFLPYSFLVFGAFKNEHLGVLLIHILCTGILLAIITEYSQALLTVNRTPELTDFLADTIGIMTGVITIALLKNKFVGNRK